MLLPVQLWFEDYSLQRAKVGSLYRETVSFTDALANINELASILAPISSANIVRGRVAFSQEYTSFAPAQPGSSRYDRAFLVFRTGENRGILPIVSPTPLSFDMDGPYRNHRITREKLEMLGVLAALESAVSAFSVPGGGPFPSTFIVGARQSIQ